MTERSASSEIVSDIFAGLVATVIILAALYASWSAMMHGHPWFAVGYGLVVFSVRVKGGRAADIVAQAEADAIRGRKKEER